MSTLLTVLSFPFWFFGIGFILAGPFGSVKINGRETREFAPRFAVTMLGVFFLLIAYWMV